MGNVFTKLRTAPVRTKALVSVIAAAVIVPTSLFAWGPSRTTFTEQNPATYVTFNSITNNSFYGDERNFVTIKDSANKQDGGWKDTLTAEPGKEYTVRMYVHNNAADNLNKVATNTRASAGIGAAGKTVGISGFVSADNASPTKVWDDVNLTSDKNFSLSFVPGSAKFHNNSVGVAPEGVGLPDSIISASGTLLGYDKLDGNIPGCYKYSGYVYFKVKPQFTPDTPNFVVNKQVRKAGATDGFKESVAVNPGDTVNYRIEFKNTGNTTLNNVIVKDQLPTGMTFIPGTVKILNAGNSSGALLKDGDKLVTTGANIGHYNGGGTNALVVFDAKAVTNDKLPTCGVNKLVNTASAQPEGKTPKSDTADVTVNKTCQPGTITVCDLKTKTTVTIAETAFDSSKHSRNLADCKPTPMCPTPGKTHLPASSPDCYKCPVPGKEDLDKNSPDCVTPVTPLPETGIDNTVLTVIGLGIATAGIGYAATSRRIRDMLIG